MSHVKKNDAAATRIEEKARIEAIRRSRSLRTAHSVADLTINTVFPIADPQAGRRHGPHLAAAAAH